MCEQKISKQTNPQLRVYIANLGKYNQGELTGGWLNLPATHNEIQAFLKNQVELNNINEEYAIHDFESEFCLGEYENLYDLNLLAVMLEQMSEHEKTIAAAYCNANSLKDTQSILNTCKQIDELSYVELDANTWGSREEKLGYVMVDEFDSELKMTLEHCQLGSGLCAYDYFDFEKYGRDIELSDGYFASDELFIFYSSDIDVKLYTVQEIKDELCDARLEEV